MTLDILTLPQVVANRAPRFREAAYAAIKDAILLGRLGLNQPLVEEQLASMLAISRTPVREALALLEHDQLIGPRGGRGLYVAPVSREQFVAMFVANEAVEPFLVRQAARLATPAQLGELVATLSQAEQSVGNADLAGFLRASRSFHRLVGEAAGNAPLTDFVVRNEERADMYLLSAGRALDMQTMQASNTEHAAILAAVRSGDAEAAARLSVYHAQSLRTRLGDLFSERPE
ncbi:MAG: GntR family transcriptional regulator [Roseiflexaceae bacterium]|nr:GntR family transcriptional regulator [Roseiflexaceae bacterium]